jgi:hypothetical protein
MINRLLYKIQSLPPGEREEDVISYLESQHNYGELTFHAGADTGKISMTVPRLYTYQYKDFFIEVIPINNHLYITCHKITPGLLTEKHGQIREKLTALNIYLGDFEKELRLTEFRARESMKLRMEEKIRTLKRELKSELINSGVNVKPGSALSKILRLDNPSHGL